MFKRVWNVVDFLYNDFKKIFNHKFQKILGGIPILAPQTAVPPKMTTQHCLWHYSLLQNNFLLKKCECLQKKIELNMLRFDRDVRVLNLKKNICQIFHFPPLQTKNTVNQRVLQDFSKKNLHGQNTPLFYTICRSTLILGDIKKPPKKTNIAVGPEPLPLGNSQDQKRWVRKG